MTSAEHPVRPFARAGLLGRALPFAGTTLLAFALVPLPPAETRPQSLLLAASLAIAIAVSAALVPWARLPSWLEAVPPLAYLPMVALIRDAEGGGASGYAPLVLLPAIWMALYGTRRQLAVSAGLTAVCLSVPILLAGAPLYPPSEWRRMFLLVITAGIVGVTVQKLVAGQQELAGRLERLAHADALTELPNRRAWDVQIAREIGRAERDGSRLCVALLDLDHFKRYNDSLGHPAGDSLLQACARAWPEELRVTDVLARHGGEEFALLLPGCNLEHALEAAERLRAATPAGQTCSVGVAEWRAPEDAAALFSRVDRALYEAKSHGRDRVCASELAPVAVA